MQLLCTFIYVCGSYFLTGNYIPGEYNRFMLFTLMCLMVTISAQSWGFFIGSTMPIKVRNLKLFSKMWSSILIFVSHILHRLRFSLVRYWRFCFRYSAFVHVMWISIRCSHGCGTLAISVPVFMVFWIPYTVWIERIYGVHHRLNLSIAISGNRKYFCVKLASVNLIHIITFIWCLA